MKEGRNKMMSILQNFKTLGKERRTNMSGKTWRIDLLTTVCIALILVCLSSTQVMAITNYVAWMGMTPMMAWVQLLRGARYNMLLIMLAQTPLSWLEKALTRKPCRFHRLRPRVLRFRVGIILVTGAGRQPHTPPLLLRRPATWMY